MSPEQDDVSQLAAQCAGGFAAAGSKVMVVLSHGNRTMTYSVESVEPESGPQELVNAMKSAMDVPEHDELSVLVYALVGGFDSTLS